MKRPLVSLHRGYGVWPPSARRIEFALAKRLTLTHFPHYITGRVFGRRCGWARGGGTLGSSDGSRALSDMPVCPLKGGPPCLRCRSIESETLGSPRISMP